jgi:pyruvate formate lyase activating enzyme
VISVLENVADLLLYDLKFMDDDLHRQYAGVSNTIIQRNLKNLAQWHTNIQVRVPCIAGINDSVDQIRATARFVAEAGLSHIVLLPFNGAAGAKYAWIDQGFCGDGWKYADDDGDRCGRT